MVVDESMIPYRGRLLFRQYNPGKAAKYGIKLFKLCSTNGYTYAFSVYTGRSVAANENKTIGVAEKVCRDLGHDLFGEGRTLVVDNFYTSFELAQYCLERRSHLVGTVRVNKKYFPIEVLRAKLKKGQVVAKEDQNGIVLLTWRDARDVRMLSTRHAPDMITKSEYNSPEDSNSPAESTSTENNNDDDDDANGSPANPREERSKIKPRVIHFYNKAKCGIDLSDQMASYATSLRKGIKWYRKLATELLLGTSLVNSWIVYKAATGRNIQIRKFRFEIASVLTGIPISDPSIIVSKKQHFLGEQTTRKNCRNCYSRIVDTVGRENARNRVKKTYFYCKECPDRPFLCLECFNVLHKVK